LCSFSNYDKEVLNKILNNGGGTRFEEIDERVSHVIVGDVGVSNFAAMKEQNLK
jgi:topoisomerase (DNA) II binding protein 1